MTPRATYRVQFHADFTFADAERLAPYWAGLGISHVYASPIATARKGSIHGYDVVDPMTINPALGGEEGFRSLVETLRRHDLGVILDIVPNHVAVGGDDNEWWLDVLAKGPASAYARFFDIDWNSGDPALEGKLLAPFLGGPYAEVLASGDLFVEAEPERDRISVVAYGSHRFPIRREDHAAVLGAAGADRLEHTTPEALARAFDGKSETGKAALHELLERQHYRLAHWRTAGDQINWRRFFDISELAGLRIEDKAVFEAVHALPLRLYAEGLIDGLRIDHVDGLADPAAYCRRLRQRLTELEAQRPATASSGPAYLVIEKILAVDEPLASDWLTDGTTGYDFMNDVSAVLHDPAGAGTLDALWTEISGRTADFHAEERLARGETLDRSFAGQLDACAAAFERLARSDLATRDLTLAGFRRAARAMMTVFPVYRTYGVGDAAPGSDAAIREGVVAAAIDLAGPSDAEAIRQIAQWLAGEGGGDADLKADAVRRFQQLSAPVSAKSVEDTAFYRFGRLLSRTDVGFDPARLGASAEDFHAAVRARAATHPHAMLATATHDHKRGEDGRARLAVLSDLPDLWAEAARRWQASAPLDGVSPGDAYQLHQAIVGAWPLELSASDAEGLSTLRDRLAGWQQKALREAKLRSSWAMPDETYEGACRAYLDVLLAPGSAFLTEAVPFIERIAPAGVAKSLAQTLLKLIVPGVPDVYQGTEGWDFSLVDPDNRRPVDYAAREAWLGAEGDAGGWRDGAGKAALIARLLHERRRHPELFASGDYEPLTLEGARADQALAFVRRHGGVELLVVCATRASEACVQAKDADPSIAWWGDTRVAGRSVSEITKGEVFGWRLDG
ncbi:malto-oligosyltrehalose synthase [Brevundimonas sp. PAMC22021]|uniref:malto-oligosyltrehalose synthase n=1 Tax=Brevundimonas sp. PAMC22021 TaxID=2861285 RepID=UPI001C62D604|nr:malto-oligosyltrehalose synthase [Brevundimonas sp. PAMC22021]QYF87833.1 malto-oligosyltrehalose synthase [Brevundimonas sp. PAMC22021]